MLKYLYCLATILALPSIAIAQEKFTLSGYMRDASTGEELLYANVLVKEQEVGTTTNLYGFYSLTLPEGTYTIQYSYIGLATQEITVQLNEDKTQDIELSAGATELVEVVVTAENETENVTNTEVSTVTLDTKEAKLIPVLMGEQDILKTMQLLPGVSSNSEGGSGFFVRGGDADQNLILLDEAPVYNASHLLGFFSVFNSDAIKDVKLYKGGMPAEYGGRVSSIMDIRMKNGNTKEWKGAGGIGLIASRLTVEGPIKKDQGSIMLSGRRTYADIVARPFLSDEFEGAKLYFYDLNLKANYKLGEKDRLYLSGYLGRDVFGTDDFGFDWGNTTTTLRWNHLFNDKLFLNTTFIYSDYDYGFKVENGGGTFELGAGIYDYNVKQDFNWYANPNNTISFGWQGIFHQIKPSEFKLTDEDGEVLTGDPTQEQKALEGSIYISNQQKVNNKLSLNYGLRMNLFSNVGEYTEKTYDDRDNVLTQTNYDKGEFYNGQIGLAPRINATYLLGESNSLKASFNRNYQYLHLLSNSNAGTPTDYWIASSPFVKPQIANQVALGYFHNFKENMYEFSVEAYYKQLENQVDFEDGGSAINNREVESDLVFGEGRAYGLEFYLKKSKGRFTGWLSYTLSKSERQFDEISDGNWFSARQDRTHDISLVGMYKISDRLTASASFVYYTGDAVTFPVGKYYVGGELVNLYGERNSERMPDYHRLDLGMTYILKQNSKFNSDLTLSIYNVYNRKNAYSISFLEDDAGQTKASKLSLFGIIPSVAWNFNF